MTEGQSVINSEMASNERTVEEFKANYTQSEGRAVGGKLTLTTQRLLFSPNKLDEYLGGDEIEISFDEIHRITKKEKASGGLKDTLFGGGLKDRLHIELIDGSDKLFVINNLDSVIEKINNEMEEGTPSSKFCSSCGSELEAGTKFCPDCGEAQREEQKRTMSQEGKGKTKITFSKIIAYFFGGAGLILGIFYLIQGPAIAGFFLGIAGTIGFPKTRRKIEEKAELEFSKWVATVLFLVFWILGSLMLGV